MTLRREPPLALLAPDSHAFAPSPAALAAALAELHGAGHVELHTADGRTAVVLVQDAPDGAMRQAVGVRMLQAATPEAVRRLLDAAPRAAVVQVTLPAVTPAFFGDDTGGVALPADAPLALRVTLLDALEILCEANAEPRLRCPRCDVLLRQVLDGRSTPSRFDVGATYWLTTHLDTELTCPSCHGRTRIADCTQRWPRIEGDAFDTSPLLAGTLTLRLGEGLRPSPVTPAFRPERLVATPGAEVLAKALGCRFRALAWMGGFA